ncbi:hypothetical protein BSL78_10099, partial [Apostichopus japonicus]
FQPRLSHSTRFPSSSHASCFHPGHAPAEQALGHQQSPLYVEGPPPRREGDGHVDRENRRNGLRISRLENFHVDAAAGKPSEVCDEIEEHFRRSLGQNYREEKPLGVSPSRSPVEVMPLTPPASASLPNTSPPVSISGSVDDHFAKALEISGVESRRRWNRAPPRPTQHRPQTRPLQLLSPRKSLNIHLSFLHELWRTVDGYECWLMNIHK